jgi:hypothetical protein
MEAIPLLYAAILNLKLFVKHKNYKMKKLSEMSKDERSLLLFFECASVDYGGKLNTAHMNADDMKLAAKWTKEGFVTFERIASKFLKDTNSMTGSKTHAVVMSEDAWALAHEERRERAKRVYSKKEWLTVSEYRSCPIE